jgi:hypothetical protein
MSKPLYLIRWVLVPPSAIFGFYLAFFGSLYLLGFIGKFCPEESIISETCMARWYLRAENAMFSFGAALAAIFVVLFPSLLAPNYRFKVAVVAYLLGALAALWIGGGFFVAIWKFPFDSFVWAMAWPMFAALGAGLITVLFLRWLLFRKSH